MIEVRIRRIEYMISPLNILVLISICFGLVSCGNQRLPNESRESVRNSRGNTPLRLPSTVGSKPDQKSRWWDGGYTRYPNPGYYSSERR